jgi:hypothetical protein
MMSNAIWPVCAAELRRAAVRTEGRGRLEDVQAVILESDGNLSDIGKSTGIPTALTPDFPADGHER